MYSALKQQFIGRHIVPLGTEYTSSDLTIILFLLLNAAHTFEKQQTPILCFLFFPIDDLNIYRRHWVRARWQVYGSMISESRFYVKDIWTAILYCNFDFTRSSTLEANTLNITRGSVISKSNFYVKDIFKLVLDSSTILLHW